MSSNVSIFIAFGAGLVSFFSPCILPLIPSYLTLLLGNYAEQDNRKTSILPALLFITGFTITFIILGLSASLLGKLLLKNLSFFRKLSGIIVLILGVHLTGIINLSFLQQNKDLQIPAETNRYFRGLVMGFALAFAWTPCIGPILSILIYAGTGQTVMQGGALLTFYAGGLALPFFLAAIFINRLLPYFKKINPYLPLIQKISGGLIIILGILIYFGHL
ncbi:MAG: cytochrome c biogenesis protein CcdA [Firmicutes bacterium]|nr:cytochrome c biogenesis protein CcdA [Bacillota bacterium]